MAHRSDQSLNPAAAGGDGSSHLGTQLVAGLVFGLGWGVAGHLHAPGSTAWYASIAVWAAVVCGTLTAVLPRRRFRHLPRWLIVALAALSSGVAVPLSIWVFNRLWAR